MGRILAHYSSAPSFGVVVASGIVITCDGQIFDHLGLNWVEIAQTEGHRTGADIDYGCFKRTVIYPTPPAILRWQIVVCDRPSYDSNRLFDKELHGVFRDELFQEIYDFECNEGLRFYRLAE